MHVLVVAPGASPHSRKVINMLLEAGCRVTLTSNVDSLQTCPTGYTFLTTPGLPGTQRLPARVAERLLPTLQALQYRRLFRRLRPDVVNVQGVDRRAYACARAGLRPLVLTCWGSDINDLFDLRTSDPGYRTRLSSLTGIAQERLFAAGSRGLERHKLRIGRALSRAAAVTADSTEILARCETLAGHPLRTALFRFGVRFEQFESVRTESVARLRSELQVPASAKLILDIRGMQPLMGHLFVLRAFASLLEKRRGAELVLLFKDFLAEQFPEERRLLQREVERLGLGARVRWMRVGDHDEVAAQYHLADVLVNFAEQDAFPVSLLEAMASRRPIVSSRLAAYADVLDGAIGVRRGDVAGLARALETALDEPATESQVRAARAHALARRTGDWDTNRQLLVDLLGTCRTDMQCSRR